MKRKSTRRKVNNSDRTRRSAKKKFVQPRDLQQFLGMPKRYQELWGDIGQIVTEVREGATLAHASRKFHRDPRTVQRLAAPALRKRRNGRWTARNNDRLLRVLLLPLLKRI